MLFLKNWKLWAAGVLLALASGGLIYGLWQRSEVVRLSTYAQDLENRVAGLESSEKALRKAVDTAHRAQQEAQARYNRSRKELDRVLKEHSDWAGQPVPDGVWDALRPVP